MEKVRSVMWWSVVVVNGNKRKVCVRKSGPPRVFGKGKPADYRQ